MLFKGNQILLSSENEDSIGITRYKSTGPDGILTWLVRIHGGEFPEHSIIALGRILGAVNYIAAPLRDVPVKC